MSAVLMRIVSTGPEKVPVTAEWTSEPDPLETVPLRSVFHKAFT